MTPEKNDPFAFLEKALADAACGDGPQLEVRVHAPDPILPATPNVVPVLAGELVFAGDIDDYAMDYPEKAKAPCMGRVEIKAIVDDPGAPDHGQVVSHVFSNTITFDARGIMARALAGLAEAKITTVGWGSDNTPPDRSNTQLGNELITSGVIEPASFPTPDSVVFSSTLAPNVGTGQTYTEVGLKSAGGDLFARFTFPPQEKFPRLRLSVNWQIIFI